MRYRYQAYNVAGNAAARQPPDGALS